MAGVDDLKAAVASVVTAITNGVAAVTAEIAAVDAAIAKLQAGGLSDADAEALAQQLSGVSANLGTATASLTAETTKVSAL